MTDLNRTDFWRNCSGIVAAAGPSLLFGGWIGQLQKLMVLAADTVKRL